MSARELHGSNSIDLEVDVVPSDHVQRVGNRWREAAPKRLWFLCIATYVHETRASCPMKTQQLTHRPRTLTCSIVLLVYTFSWTSAYYGNNSYFSTSAVKDDRIRACKPTGNDKKAILQSSRWHSLPTSPSCPSWPSTPSTPTYLRECSCRALGSDSHASPKVFAKLGLVAPNEALTFSACHYDMALH